MHNTTHSHSAWMMRITTVSVWLCVLFVPLSGCFSEVEGLSCDSDADCFPNVEKCSDGLCARISEIGTSATTQTTTTPQENRFSVVGTVTDRATNEPLQGILVQVDIASSVATNDQGAYVASVSLPLGNPIVISIAPDNKYRGEEKTVLAPDGGTITVDFQLTEQNCPDDPTQGTPEPRGLCDGEDNDCDGAIDEGATNDCGGCRFDVQLGSPCGPCSEGTWQCEGQDGFQCFDNNLILVPNSDSIEGDPCNRSQAQRCGQIQCVDGAQSCEAAAMESGLSCSNNHDDDCDGDIDDDDADCSE